VRSNVASIGGIPSLAYVGAGILIVMTVCRGYGVSTICRGLASRTSGAQGSAGKSSASPHCCWSAFQLGSRRLRPLAATLAVLRTRLELGTRAHLARMRSYKGGTDATGGVLISPRTAEPARFAVLSLIEVLLFSSVLSALFHPPAGWPKATGTDTHPSIATSVRRLERPLTERLTDTGDPAKRQDQAGRLRRRDERKERQ
jgi:hypothetical protein